MTEYLRTKGRVVSLEAALRPYERTKARLGGEVHHCLLEDFASDEKFDSVIATGVLEHVEKPDAFLQKVRTFMNGELILTVPNASSLHRQIGKKMGLLGDLQELSELDREVGHYRYYDASSLKQVLTENDFRVKSMTGILVKPVQFEFMERFSERYLEALYNLSDELPDLCAEVFVVAT